MIYAVIQDNKHVEMTELRETKAYLINDTSGVRYRKRDYTDGCVATFSSGEGFYRCMYSVFPKDHVRVADTLLRRAKESYSLGVSRHLRELYQNFDSKDFYRVKEVAKMLGLDEFKHEK